MKIINLCPFCDEIFDNRSKLKTHVIKCNREDPEKSLQDENAKKSQPTVKNEQIQKRVEVIRIRSIQNFEAPEKVVPGNVMMQKKTGSLIRISKIKNFHI